jgi:hypothetical protein
MTVTVTVMGSEPPCGTTFGFSASNGPRFAWYWPPDCVIAAEPETPPTCQDIVTLWIPAGAPTVADIVVTDGKPGLELQVD